MYRTFSNFRASADCLKRRIKATLVLASMLLVAGIALGQPPTTLRYSATEIPEPQLFNVPNGPVQSLTPSAINNRGEVTGTAVFAGGPFVRAFLYNGQTTLDLGTITGAGKQSFGYGINDSGEVVGQSEQQPVSAVPLEAFLYSNGGMIGLDTPPGFHGTLRLSAAFGINDLGQITGFRSPNPCTVFCVDIHAFLYTAGVLTDIGTLGGNFSEGRGINNREEITGGSNLTANGPNHVFLYSRGEFHDLGTFEGYSSEGLAINDDSQIIGKAVEPSGAPIGFLYRDGSFHRLPPLNGGTYSLPSGINNHGDIVGMSNVAPVGPTHAFLYTGGKVIDLNSLVNDPSLPLLTSAAGINDQGQIAASGLNGRGYILTPKH